MILTTTNSIEGFKIIDYKGIVTGVAVNRKQTGMSFSMTKYYDSLESNIEEIKEVGFQKLKDNAKKLNANAVVGINVDIETFATSGILMISVTGTAVHVVSEK
ncbi:heavy metal-binding domain-containing protein [Lacinutrix sp. Bg11-31]|uniref:heavy metal-binding domain-containing protein n=1 Tax=Lacinutrix sp. Bg11-31 TaxID=2057808 RepID=UPI000C30A395|nr:heavy metal-binding domain-containing protein [Lacinutrix sp. Bg11-31]AUC82990.1 hypothetical protein CW733_12980 [Lacinutrix sp. Bg11-31]